MTTFDEISMIFDKNISYLELGLTLLIGILNKMKYYTLLLLIVLTASLSHAQEKKDYVFTINPIRTLYDEVMVRWEFQDEDQNAWAVNLGFIYSQDHMPLEGGRLGYSVLNDYSLKPFLDESNGVILGYSRVIKEQSKQNNFYNIDFLMRYYQGNNISAHVVDYAHSSEQTLTVDLKSISLQLKSSFERRFRLLGSGFISAYAGIGFKASKNIQTEYLQLDAQYGPDTPGLDQARKLAGDAWLFAPTLHAGIKLGYGVER